MSDDETRRILKVFVGSPGDVVAEREAVSEVIDRLNPQLDQVHFDAVRWELHPHLRDTRHTPQQAIKLGIPRPRDCEVAVFIFWTRIGTVLDMKGLPANGAGDRPTGTTWEFYDALESGKPLVLTYRKTSPPPYNRLTLDEDELDTVGEQERGLRQFFKSLRGPNGEYKNYTHPFTDLAEFTRTICRSNCDCSPKNTNLHSLPQSRLNGTAISTPPRPPICSTCRTPTDIST